MYKPGKWQTYPIKSNRGKKIDLNKINSIVLPDHLKLVETNQGKIHEPRRPEPTKKKKVWKEGNDSLQISSSKIMAGGGVCMELSFKIKA